MERLITFLEFYAKSVRLVPKNALLVSHVGRRIIQSVVAGPVNTADPRTRRWVRVSLNT
jgi:hypothetical protein